jgi:hypothetical protein
MSLCKFHFDWNLAALNFDNVNFWPFLPFCHSARYSALYSAAQRERSHFLESAAQARAQDFQIAQAQRERKKVVAHPSLIKTLSYQRCL